MIFKGSRGPKRMVMVFVSAITLALTACQSVDLSDSETINALILGNDYEGTGYDLDNPVRDAQLVASKLRAQGHMVETGYNLTSANLEASLDAFIEKIERQDTVFFYFSGHGLQDNKENYVLTNDGVFF